MIFPLFIYIYYSLVFYILSLGLFISRLYFIFLDKIYIIEWVLLNFNNLEIVIPLIFDKYGLLFSSVVLFISANVFIFSNYYIEYEVYPKRFLYLVILFIISINFLIFIPRLIGLLLGWDGLGLVSFLLVIYYQNNKSLRAGILTALTNRVGDIFLLLSIGWSLNQGHWICCFIWNNRYSFFIIFSIMLARITKSAQIPFSRWLPAAISAPTPVRALVHSSTLVTAGVFLLIRFYPYLSRVEGFNFIILVISCLTIFISGFRALFECDIKKIVALSTLRQLGVIISAVGLGLPNLAFFHLITHALFKALLFICVGTLIHLHHHSQDLRSMGNIIFQLPLTLSCLNVANIALCGLPFLSGFYSKDLIIEITLYNNNNFIILLLFIFGTIFTAGYSIRLVLTGLTSMNININIQYINENTLDNTFPICILALGGVVRGCLLNWIFIVPAIEPSLGHNIKLIPFLLTLFGAIFLYNLIILTNSFTFYNKLTHDFSSFMWFISPMSSQMVLTLPFQTSKYSLILIDQGWVEISGAQGLFLRIQKTFFKYQNFQNSIISIHITLIVIACLLIIIIYLDSLS